MSDVLLADAARTPHGRFLGALADVEAVDRFDATDQHLAFTPHENPIGILDEEMSGEEGERSFM